MKKYFLLVIVILFQIVIAQNVNQINLAKVDVVGNIITSENTIIFTSGLREGTMVNPTDFPRAIKRLWQLGLFKIYNYNIIKKRMTDFSENYSGRKLCTW